jgi:hypothetical protein
MDRRKFVLGLVGIAAAGSAASVFATPAEALTLPGLPAGAPEPSAEAAIVRPGQAPAEVEQAQIIIVRRRYWWRRRYYGYYRPRYYRRYYWRRRYW